jgi:hypothetical protein
MRLGPTRQWIRRPSPGARSGAPFFIGQQAGIIRHVLETKANHSGAGRNCEQPAKTKRVLSERTGANGRSAHQVPDGGFRARLGRSAKWLDAP